MKKTNQPTTATEEQKTIYKKITRGKNSFVYGCLLFAILLSLLFTPAFNVKYITVSGNARVSSDSIVEASGLYKGVNILKADLNQAALSVSKLPFIDQVEVSRSFPSTITIAVTESEARAYVRFMGNLVALSEDGKVLQIVPDGGEAEIPVILGLSLTQFEVGAKVALSEPEKMDILLSYLSEVPASGLLETIKTIDMTDIDAVKLSLTNDRTVLMGGADKLSYKLAYLAQVAQSPEAQRGGEIDISNADGSAIFKGSQDEDGRTDGSTRETGSKSEDGGTDGSKGETDSQEDGGGAQTGDEG